MQRLGWLPALFTLLATPVAAADWLYAADRRTLDETAQHSLEYAQTNQSSTWVNPDTDSAGSFTPVATHDGPQGQVCREYTIIGRIGGREEQIYGIACRQADGSWLEANSERTATAPPVSATYSTPYSTANSRSAQYDSDSSWRVQQWIIPNISILGSYCSDGFCVGGRYGYASWLGAASFRYHHFSGGHHSRHRHHSKCGHHGYQPYGWGHHRDYRHEKPSHHHKNRSHHSRHGYGH